MYALECGAQSAHVFEAGVTPVADPGRTADRYTVASADPEQIITKLCSLPKQATDSVEVDKKERSLTRSLTRSAASSPLVQLLATHRKRRYTPPPCRLLYGI